MTLTDSNKSYGNRSKIGSRFQESLEDGMCLGLDFDNEVQKLEFTIKLVNKKLEALGVPIIPANTTLFGHFDTLIQACTDSTSKALMQKLKYDCTGLIME